MPERTTDGVNPASAIMATTNKSVAADALRFDRIKLTKNLSITPVRIDKCNPETTVICEIPETVEKVREIRTYALAHKIDVDIQVDGGINTANLKQVTEAGANVVVAGSAIFGAKRVKDVIDAMKETAKLYPFGSGLHESLSPSARVRKR